MTVFRAAHVDLAAGADRNPIEAWDIAAITEHYAAFDRQWRPLLQQVRDGRIAGPRRSGPAPRSWTTTGTYR
ncbi:hypothetical protein ACFQZ4_50125 [Catellatospora coxensis]